MICVRQFHRTWDGTDQSSSCGITVSFRTWVPQECLEGSYGLTTIPWHIYWLKRTHRTWDGSNRFSSCRVTASTKIWMPHGKAQEDTTTKWPCCYTSTDQNGSIELEMERIGPAVVELQHLQLWWTEGWKDRRRLFYSLLLNRSFGKTGDKNNIPVTVNAVQTHPFHKEQQFPEHLPMTVGLTLIATFTAQLILSWVVWVTHKIGFEKQVFSISDNKKSCCPKKWTYT